MKKLIAMFLALMMVLSLAACGGNSATENSSALSSDSSDNSTSSGETTEAPEPSEEMEAPLSSFEMCAEYAVSQLKDIMKNPNSLSINHFYGVEDEESFIFEIDYSGENSLGGAARELFYLDVAPRENGFAVISIGSSSYASEDNQAFTKQIYDNKAAWSYYEFDVETYRMIAVYEPVHEYEEVEGELRGKNTSYENAWNFSIPGDSYQKLLYFADGVDLSPFNEEYSPFDECKVTIRGFKVNNAYYDVTIINADAYKTAEDRFATFNFNDREFFKELVKDMTPLTEETIKSILEERTFSMRNNIGGDGDGTHTITFYSNGSLDAKYNFNGTDNVMYDSWRIENGSVILTTPKGDQKSFKAYQYDDTRFLLIDEEERGDYSMALTAK